MKKKDEKKEEKKDESKTKEVKIDFNEFEQRVVILPPSAGNIANLQAITGKVVFHRMPNNGAADKKETCFLL